MIVRNLLEIFNEMTVLIVTYHFLLFTDYNFDTNIQYNAGVSTIAITILNLSINMLIMIIMTIKQII